MAAGHGKAAKIYAGGTDLSTYMTTVSHAMTADTAEVSTLGNTAKVYVPGLKDGTIPMEGFWDGSAAAIDAILSASLAGTGTILTHWPAGDAFGARGRAGQALHTSYEVTTPVDDAGGISAEFQASGGLDSVYSLFPLQSRNGAAVLGTNLDNTASSAAGGVGYLHVVSVTGGTGAIYKVQHSVDNSVWVDLITFSTVSAGGSGAQRSAVAGTVNRHVRGWVNTGGGTSVGAIGFARL